MLELARDAAWKAGRFLLQNLGSLSQEDIGYKGHIDLVTRVDRESEAIVIGEIQRRYPDHGIVAEESPRRESSSEYTWVIDPLDGTTNYVHSFPLFCVSIGLLKANEPIAGAIYVPCLDEMFLAETGKGAFLNDKPIHVSGAAEMSAALLCTGFASLRHPGEPDNLGNFIRVIRRSQGVRRGGSAATELAYVAAGRLDGFWELNLSPWDVAAGSVLVREAGGRVTDMRGGPGYLFGRNLLATNGLLHEPLRELLRPEEQLGEIA